MDQNYSARLYSLFDEFNCGFEVPHDVFKWHVKNIYHQVVKFLTIFSSHINLHQGRKA